MFCFILLKTLVEAVNIWNETVVLNSSFTFQDVAAAAGDVLAGVEDTDRREKRGWNSGNATPLWNN